MMATIKFEPWSLKNGFFGKAFMQNGSFGKALAKLLNISVSPGYKLWSQNSFANKVGMQIGLTGHLNNFLCCFTDSIT